MGFYADQSAMREPRKPFASVSNAKMNEYLKRNPRPVRDQ